jgi:flavin-dependent dehydrogenase
MPSRDAYDAVVVGARCAGAATALLLARGGLRVLAVDRSPAGSDTLSTHALMRGAVLQLHRWGLLDRVRAAGTPVVRSTSFHYPGESVRVAIKPDGDLDGLYAPRRHVLDGILATAAAEAGAEVRHGVTLLDLQRGRDGAVGGVVLGDGAGRRTLVRAGLVVGADGVASTVARRLGAATSRTGRHAVACVYGYWTGLPVEGYQWHYAPTASAGAIPTNDGQTCVFVAFPSAGLREAVAAGVDAGYHALLAQAAPELAASVTDARPAGRLRGFGGQAGFLRQSWGRGWALVGDAGYFRDPLTAHGITDALRDAEILARAVLAGTPKALAEYQATRDGLAAGLFDVSDRVASFAWTVEELKGLHRTLSAEMKREVEFLRGLGELPRWGCRGAVPGRGPRAA